MANKAGEIFELRHLVLSAFQDVRRSQAELQSKTTLADNLHEMKPAIKKRVVASCERLKNKSEKLTEQIETCASLKEKRMLLQKIFVAESSVDKFITSVRRIKKITVAARVVVSR